jgi:hypothetical protein
MTVMGSALALATSLVIVGVWALNWKFGFPASADKISRLNTVIAVAAYVAAMIAAGFAIVAYRQASGLPELEPVIKFQANHPNTLNFWVNPDRQIPPWVTPALSGATELVMLHSPNSMIGSVLLKNNSRYSARNPGLRIEFDGLLFNAANPYWTTVEWWTPHHANGSRIIQWDGGVDNIVHGNWSRGLPDLNFNEVVVTRKNPSPKLVVTFIADGCDPVTKPIAVNIQEGRAPSFDF